MGRALCWSVGPICNCAPFRWSWIANRWPAKSVLSTLSTEPLSELFDTDSEICAAQCWDCRWRLPGPRPPALAADCLWRTAFKGIPAAGRDFWAAVNRSSIDRQRSLWIILISKHRPAGCRTIVSSSNYLMAGKTPPDGPFCQTMKPRSHTVALSFATSRGSTITRA